ncbi:MAG: glycosyltransferase family 9 protein, partial [Terriglobales bacterium]
MTPAYLIVKLAAAGDVLLTTALSAALRQARPGTHIAWLTTGYAAPLLAGNPDVDEVLLYPEGGRAATAMRMLARLRRWNHVHPQAVVLAGHRSRSLAALLRIAGVKRLHALPRGRQFDPSAHRLAWQAGLLAAADIRCDWHRLRPRLELSAEERAGGERLWHGASRPRWVLACGGGANPWAAMPNRRWPLEGWRILAARARAGGISLRWVGGAGEAGEERDNLAGKLGVRQSAAVIAAADLVIGNDSLPLVLAQAVRRPGLGLYGPTAGAAIHA